MVAGTYLTANDYRLRGAELELQAFGGSPPSATKGVRILQSYVQRYMQTMDRLTCGHVGGPSEERNKLFDIFPPDWGMLGP